MSSPPPPPPNRPVPLDKLNKDGVLAASKEAENAPTLFEPRERAKYVRERVSEVRRLRALGQNDEQIKAAVGDFATQYPTLFQMAAASNFSEQKLNMMLTMLDKMGGGMTQHQASVVVGQVLADSYIKPVVDRTPPDRLPR